MTLRRLTIVASLAVIAGSVTAAPAFAKDHSWPIGNDQYHVYYRDLDLNSANGRGAMLTRIEAAAVKLCSPRMSLKIDVDACVVEVVAEAASRNATVRLALDERGRPQLATR